MAKPPLTRSRAALALAIAVCADAIQFPITGLTATGIFAIPGEIADFMVDCAVMGATVALLGFHWVLLPSILVELIPGADLLPTWTGCVAFVIWRRRKEEALPMMTVINVEALPVRPPPLPRHQPQSLPPPISENASVEARLARLDRLLANKAITPAEYERKRQQILNEI